MVKIVYYLYLKNFQVLCYQEPAMHTRRSGRLMLSTVAFFLSHIINDQKRQR